MNNSIFSNKWDYCARPWTSLMLYPNQAGPECQISVNFMTETSDITIGEIWNSPEFIRLRKKILKREYPDVCKDCVHKIGIEFYNQFEYMNFIPQSLDNFNKNKNEYIHGSTFLTSNPISISTDLQYQCNFKCVTCDLRFSSGKISQKHEEELFNVFSKTSIHMHYSGGEPLLHEGFAGYLKSGNCKPTSISITTNGSLLNKDILENLMNFSYVNLHISIDSFDADKFSELRPGPIGLKEIITNLKLAIDYKKQINTQYKEHRWHICLQLVLTLNNIEELPEYLDTAYSMNVDEISLCPISGDFPNSDIIKYPDILKNIDVEELLRKIKNRIIKYADLEIAHLESYIYAMENYLKTKDVPK